ncbi:MAG: hypothetical protein PWP76_140 [Candidatus Diapherotrites archaeon]|nr:hypothetical protein [Candidatus Diapherotrites archaeon]
MRKSMLALVLLLLSVAIILCRPSILQTPSKANFTRVEILNVPPDGAVVYAEGNTLFIPSDGNYDIPVPATVIAEGRTPATVSRDTKTVFLQPEEPPQYYEIEFSQPTWACIFSSDGGSCMYTSLVVGDVNEIDKNSFLFVADAGGSWLVRLYGGTIPMVEVREPVSLTCQDLLDTLDYLGKDAFTFKLDGTPIFGVSQGGYYAIAWRNGNYASIDGPARFVGTPADVNFILADEGRRIDTENCAFLQVFGPKHRGEWLTIKTPAGELRIPILSDRMQCNDSYCVDVIAGDGVAYISLVGLRDTVAELNFTVDGNTFTSVYHLREGEILLDANVIEFNSELTVSGDGIYFEEEVNASESAFWGEGSSENNTYQDLTDGSVGSNAYLPPKLVLRPVILYPNLSLIGTRYPSPILIKVLDLASRATWYLCTNDINAIAGPEIYPEELFIPNTEALVFDTFDSAADYIKRHPYRAFLKDGTMAYIRLVSETHGYDFYCTFSNPVRPKKGDVCDGYARMVSIWCYPRVSDPKIIEETGTTGLFVARVRLSVEIIPPGKLPLKYAEGNTMVTFNNLSGCYEIERVDPTDPVPVDINDQPWVTPFAYQSFNPKCLGVKTVFGTVISNLLRAKIITVDGGDSLVTIMGWGSARPGERIKLHIYGDTEDVSRHGSCRISDPRYITNRIAYLRGDVHNLRVFAAPDLEPTNGILRTAVLSLEYNFYGAPYDPREILYLDGLDLVNTTVFPIPVSIYELNGNRAMGIKEFDTGYKLTFNACTGRNPVFDPSIYNELNCDHLYEIRTPLKDGDGKYVIRFSIRDAARLPARPTDAPNFAFPPAHVIDESPYVSFDSYYFPHYNEYNAIRNTIDSEGIYYSPIPYLRPVVYFSRYADKTALDRIAYIFPQDSLYEFSSSTSGCETPYCCNRVLCDNRLLLLSMAYAQKKGIKELHVLHVPASYSKIFPKHSFAHPEKTYALVDGNVLPATLSSSCDDFGFCVGSLRFGDEELNIHYDHTVEERMELGPTFEECTVHLLTLSMNGKFWTVNSEELTDIRISPAGYYAMWFAYSNILPEPPEMYPYAVYWDLGGLKSKRKILLAVNRGNKYFFYDYSIRGFSTRVDPFCESPKYVWGIGRGEYLKKTDSCLPSWCTRATSNLPGTSTWDPFGEFIGETAQEPVNYYLVQRGNEYGFIPAYAPFNDLIELE